MPDDAHDPDSAPTTDPGSESAHDQPAGAAYERVFGDGVAWASRWTLRWLVLVAGAVVVGWLVGKVWSVLLPVVLALALATVLEPPARFLERRARFSRTAAALTVVVLGFLVVGGVVAAMAPSVSSQATDLAGQVSGGINRLRPLAADLGLDFSDQQIDQLVSAVQDRLSSSASTIASGVFTGLTAVGSALVTGFLTLVLTFLFVKDGRRFLPWLSGVVGPRAGHHLTEIGQRSWRTLSGFVRTQALVGLIDSVLISTGLIILGVPLVAPLAVITFFAAFVPVAGAVVAGAIAVLVALVAQGWVAALIVLGIVVAVQQIEGNLLLPWLQGRSLGLHAAVVLLTVALGSSLFGIAGALFGVPVVAVAGVILRYVLEVTRERAAQDPGPPTAREAEVSRP